MVSRARAGLLIVAMIAGLGGSAVADEASNLAAAEREYQAGYRALQAGDCQTALVRYQRSYELAARPRTMFNMGVCQEQVGQEGMAWRSYQEFLRTAETRDAAIATRARERIAALRSRLRGRAFVDSSPSGAAVYLDDEPQPRGETPLALVVEPGVHRLRISGGDSPDVVRSLEIVPDGVATMSIELAAPTTVTIEVEPAGATIQPIGGGSAAHGRFQADVTTGRHRFTVTHPGYASRDVVIDALPGRAHTEHVVLRRLAAPGRLRVVAAPDAVVTLDRSTMTLGMRDVAGGVHTLGVEQPGHRSYRGEVAVGAGEDVTITVRLPPRTSRALTWGLAGAGSTAVVAGGVLGVLALRDVTSPVEADHDRGKARALATDGLLAAGAIALYAAWRTSRRHEPSIAIDRRGDGR